MRNATCLAAIQYVGAQLESYLVTTTDWLVDTNIWLLSILGAEVPMWSSQLQGSSLTPLPPA
jgi:hypothetical protein